MARHPAVRGVGQLCARPQVRHGVRRFVMCFCMLWRFHLPRLMTLWLQPTHACSPLLPTLCCRSWEGYHPEKHIKQASPAALMGVLENSPVLCAYGLIRSGATGPVAEEAAPTSRTGVALTAHMTTDSLYREAWHVLGTYQLIWCGAAQLSLWDGVAVRPFI